MLLHLSTPAWLLAALPNCLTELHVTADECITQTFEHALGCTVLIHAVNRLKNLRKLCIREGVTERTFLHPRALVRLSSLTCLELEWALFTHVGTAADVARLQSKLSIWAYFMLAWVCCLGLPVCVLL